MKTTALLALFAMLSACGTSPAPKNYCDTFITDYCHFLVRCEIQDYPSCIEEQTGYCDDKFLGEAGYDKCLDAIANNQCVSRLSDSCQVVQLDGGDGAGR